MAPIFLGFGSFKKANIAPIKRYEIEKKILYSTSGFSDGGLSIFFFLS